MAKKSTGLTKTHGPKRNLFHYWTKVNRIDFGHAGVLNKYYNKESWLLSCAARKIKTISDKDWRIYDSLQTKAEKDAWFVKAATPAK